MDLVKYLNENVQRFSISEPNINSDEAPVNEFLLGAALIGLCCASILREPLHDIKTGLVTFKQAQLKKRMERMQQRQAMLGIMLGQNPDILKDNPELKPKVKTTRELGYDSKTGEPLSPEKQADKLKKQFPNSEDLAEFQKNIDDDVKKGEEQGLTKQLDDSMAKMTPTEIAMQETKNRMKVVNDYSKEMLAKEEESYKKAQESLKDNPEALAKLETEHNKKVDTIKSDLNKSLGRISNEREQAEKDALAVEKLQALQNTTYDAEKEAIENKFKERQAQMDEMHKQRGKMIKAGDYDPDNELFKPLAPVDPKQAPTDPVKQAEGTEPKEEPKGDEGKEPKSPEGAEPKAEPKEEPKSEPKEEPKEEPQKKDDDEEVIKHLDDDGDPDGGYVVKKKKDADGNEKYLMRTADGDETEISKEDFENEKKRAEEFEDDKDTEEEGDDVETDDASDKDGKKQIENPSKIWHRKKNKATGKSTKSFYNAKGDSISPDEFKEKMEHYKQAKAKKAGGEPKTDTPNENLSLANYLKMILG